MISDHESRKVYSLFAALVALLLLLVESLDLRRLGDTDHEACCGDEKAMVVPIPPNRLFCEWNVGFEAANTSSTATTRNPGAIDGRFFFMQRWPEEVVIRKFEWLIVVPGGFFRCNVVHSIGCERETIRDQSSPMYKSQI